MGPPSIFNTENEVTKVKTSSTKSILKQPAYIIRQVLRKRRKKERNKAALYQADLNNINNSNRRNSENGININGTHDNIEINTNTLGNIGSIENTTNNIKNRNKNSFQHIEENTNNYEMENYVNHFNDAELGGNNINYDYQQYIARAYMENLSEQRAPQNLATSNNIQENENGVINNVVDVKNVNNNDGPCDDGENAFVNGNTNTNNIDNNIANMDFNDYLYGTSRDYNDDEDEDDDIDSEFFGRPAEPQSSKMSFIVGLFVAVGGFLYGYDTGLINSITDMPYLVEHFTTNPSREFTAQQVSILVSSLSLGTFFGALSAPLIADNYGRRISILLSTFIVFIAGNTLQICANGLALLCVGRVISGLAVGLISAVLPLYQAETVQKKIRGAIISTYQWAITWGLLVSSAVSQGTYSLNSSASYRIPIGLQFVWTLILGSGMIFLPESPRYYVLKDQLNKAAESLSFLRGVPVDDTGLLEELVEIKANYDYELSFKSDSLKDCFISSKVRYKQTLRMFTGIAIQTFQQFSGINFIFYYGVNFFSRTGIDRSYLVSFITYAVNVVFNVPGLFLVDFIGRRKLLISGGIMMTIANFIVSIVGTCLNSVVADKVMIAFICVFIASFSATWGGGVWVISAELYPLGVRSKCTAICAAANWLVNFICAIITPYLVDTGSHTSSLGAKIFYIWGSLNAAGVLVVYFTVYETSGLTLEEIDELYRLSPNAMGSSSINKKIRMNSITPLSSNGPGSMMLMSQADSANHRYVHPTINDNNDDNDMNLEDGKRLTNTSNDHTSKSTSSNTGIQYSEPINDINNRNNNMCTIDKGIKDKNPEEHQIEENTNDTVARHDENMGTVVDNNRIVYESSGVNMDNNLTQPMHRKGSMLSNLSTSSFDNNLHTYVDLGNGLGLNAYNRGPPSLTSDNDDPTEDIGGQDLSNKLTDFFRTDFFMDKPNTMSNTNNNGSVNTKDNNTNTMSIKSMNTNCLDLNKVERTISNVNSNKNNNNGTKTSMKINSNPSTKSASSSPDVKSFDTNVNSNNDTTDASNLPEFFKYKNNNNNIHNANSYNDELDRFKSYSTGSKYKPSNTSFDEQRDHNGNVYNNDFNEYMAHLINSNNNTNSDNFNNINNKSSTSASEKHNGSNFSNNNNNITAPSINFGNIINNTANINGNDK
ncbi:sugar porter family MFS transporter SCDLUD_000275 [Saccharomycodes ludwigii]|uniref:sugar porter family MFS transporter n=1 Tax=Saccharomycodes ludwigii TaxID=36035 RepID=UPI001E89EB78|nr:hypothetical protein SCDLUD_000275 [Saccharomycodes ludwigii]KAH3902691.1 hypothetical protein SCDLUD_000275 [Saccharomycodes ludwigii]